MFDTFHPDPPLACPCCGNTLDDFQSKDGACLLLTYRQGERVRDPNVPDPASSEEEWWALERGRDQLPSEFDIYESCPRCHAWVDAHCCAEDGVWTETRIVRATPDSKHEPR